MTVELERRVAALERRLPQGMMVSTTYGRAEVRPFQVGFPVALTSAFDPATGYSWQQQVLDRDLPGVDAPPLPRSGDHAYTPDNNTTLQPGQTGWLEVDPQAQGWIFIPVPEPLAPTLAGTASGSGSGQGAQCPISNTSIPYVAGILVENGYQLWLVQGYLQTYWNPQTGQIQLCGGNYQEYFLGCLSPCTSGSGSGAGAGSGGSSGGVCSNLTVTIASPDCPSLNGVYTIAGGASAGNTWYGTYGCTAQSACITSISFVPSGNVSSPIGGTLTIVITCPDGKTQTVILNLSGTCCPLNLSGAGDSASLSGGCCTVSATVQDLCGGPTSPCNCPSQVPLTLTVSGGCTSATLTVPWSANDNGTNYWIYGNPLTSPPASATVVAAIVSCSPAGASADYLQFNWTVIVELPNGTTQEFSGPAVVPCGTTALSVSIPACGGSGSGGGGSCPDGTNTVTASVSSSLGPGGNFTLPYTNLTCNGSPGEATCITSIQFDCADGYVWITGWCANGALFNVDIPVTVSGQTFSGSIDCTPDNVNCSSNLTCIQGTTWSISGSWT